MAGIVLSQAEFYTVISFIVGFFLMLLYNFFLVKFTPASVFLKALMNKKPVAMVDTRTGMTEFKVANDQDPGSMDVKGLGFVSMTEGSQVREKNSKATIYRVFSEFGSSIPSDYAPIIQTLRENGFKINTFADYKNLIDLCANEKYCSDYLASLKGEKKEAAEIMIKKAKELKISLMPYKTYKMHDLAFMFPNNISPVYVDAKVTAAVNREIKKQKFANQMIIYVGIFLFIGCIAAAVAYKMIKTPDPIIIDTCKYALQNGIQTIQQNITNPTM
jgi:hypothetical protein